MESYHLACGTPRGVGEWRLGMPPKPGVPCKGTCNSIWRDNYINSCCFCYQSYHHHHKEPHGPDGANSKGWIWHCGLEHLPRKWTQLLFPPLLDRVQIHTSNLPVECHNQQTVMGEDALLLQFFCDHFNLAVRLLIQNHEVCVLVPSLRTVCIFYLIAISCKALLVGRRCDKK